MPSALAESLLWSRLTYLKLISRPPELLVTLTNTHSIRSQSTILLSLHLKAGSGLTSLWFDRFTVSTR